MKRYTVISIALLVGFVAGCAVPAHAASNSFHFNCGASSGISVTMVQDPKPVLHDGHIVTHQIFSVQDEAGDVIASGEQWHDEINHKIYSISTQKVLIGAVPDGYKFGLRVMGVKGKKFVEKFICVM